MQEFIRNRSPNIVTRGTSFRSYLYYTLYRAHQVQLQTSLKRCAMFPRRSNIALIFHLARRAWRDGKRAARHGWFRARSERRAT